MALEGGGDLVGEGQVGQQASGEVDGHAEVVARCAPLGELAERLVQHVGGQRHNQARTLGEADELLRQDLAAARVTPAHERLDANEAAVV